MGAGNPNLKSFDQDRFDPTTYFIDFYEFVEKVDEEGEEICYDHICEDMQRGFEDLIEGFAWELKMSPHDLTSRKNCYAELTSAFREEGIILLEGVHTFIITESSSDLTHLPIAVIPNFKYETILEETCYENSSKEAWYDARGKSFLSAMEKLADKRWENLMGFFYKEEKEIIEKLKLWYGKGLRVRLGPWTSGPVF